ncbi:MAG: PQQ-binding-like beta-propeller repeat protein [Bacteroidota bacterium]
MIKFSLSVLFCLAFLFPGDDPVRIYQFRGESRNGIYNETGLMKEWPAEGPRLLWASSGIGMGYGSPAVTEDRIFINGDIDSMAYLFSFDLEGNLLWKKQFGKDFSVHHGGPRSTPTVVGDLVYVTSGMGDMACLRYENGEEVWNLNMISDLHGTNTLHGYAQSPLVDEDFVYCQPGGKDTNLVAMNRFTGKIKWISKGAGQIEAYSSAIMIPVKNSKQVVALSEHSLIGIDAKTGKTMWIHDLDTTGFVHANMPLYDDGYLYYVAGTTQSCAARLKLSDDGKSVTEIWRNRSFDNCMGGFVKIDNYLISTGQRQVWLKCLDADKGVVIDSIKTGRGVTIYADSMLYSYNDKGLVYLVDFHNGKLKPVSSFTVTLGTNEHFAHPVIKNGVLYIRRGDVLMAYSLRANV